MTFFPGKFRPLTQHVELTASQAHRLMHGAEKFISEALFLNRKKLAARIWKLRKRAKERALSEATKKQQHTLTQTLLAYEANYTKLLKTSKQDLLKLALHYTAQLTAETYSVNNAALSQKINRALELMGKNAHCTVFVHADELKAITTHFAKDAHVSIQASADITHGKAKISSGVGIVLIDWERELQTLTKILGA
jgi:flagellar biosynthesis/type III secretory pathway protein FliH